MDYLPPLDFTLAPHTGWTRGHHYGWTNGRHHGWHHAGWNNDRVCHTTWRHHERVRHCWSRHDHHHG